MRLATALIFLAFVAIALWAIGASPRSLQTPSVSVAIYDENPSHIWNRLYEALWVREDPQTKANRYGVRNRSNALCCSAICGRCSIGPCSNPRGKNSPDMAMRSGICKLD